jgi:tRNA A37 threonylcarbamoyladenosine dehydratase
MTFADAAPHVDRARRFGGVARLYGVEGAARIAQAHVAVVGLGGVGSWAAEALARSGVGRLTLIDFDHVAESNINRQILATEQTLGQAKVAAMRERIATIDPTTTVDTVDAFVEPDNWPALLPSVPDAVIDACDQIPAKAVMAAWARHHPAVVFICAGAAGGKRQAHRVEIDDLSKVTHDPLLASLRNRLRRVYGAPSGGAPLGVMSVFSREPVAALDPGCALRAEGSLNCHGYGSAVAVTGTFGLCAAGWVLDQLTRAKPA